MPTFSNPLRGGSDSEPWNSVGSGDSDKPKPGNWTSDLHRNVVLLWLGLWSGSRALRDPELRAACGRTGCRHRGGAGGSSSPLLLRFRFFYSPLDSPSRCRHPLDLAPKTPPAFLFGPILSQFFLYPVPSYKTPAPPSSPCVHTETHSATVPGKRKYCTRPLATYPNSVSYPRALLRCPHASLSGDQGDSGPSFLLSRGLFRGKIMKADIPLRDPPAEF